MEKNIYKILENILTRLKFYDTIYLKLRKGV